MEDEAELTLDKVEEDMMAEYDDGDDEEEEDILHMDDLKDLTKQKVWLKFHDSSAHRSQWLPDKQLI